VTDADARTKGERELSSLVEDARRRGGFISNGTFVSQLVEVRDAAGAVLHRGEIVAPWGTSEALLSNGGIWGLPTGPGDSFRRRRSHGTRAILRGRLQDHRGSLFQLVPGCNAILTAFATGPGALVPGPRRDGIKDFA
jgi:hypothetical protein